MKRVMDVEIKLRLPNAAAHGRLLEALAAYRHCTHLQENLFFDNAGGELSSRLVVLGARFYDGDSSCMLYLKANPRLVGGVNRVELWHEDVDPEVVRPCVAEPWRLAEMARDGSSHFMARVAKEFELLKQKRGAGGGGKLGEEIMEEEEEGGGSLVCLGGFCNVRKVHLWRGLKLDVDETHYDFGTRYEVECETEEPETAKEVLERFLKESDIPYTYSEATKFRVFMAGKLVP